MYNGFISFDLSSGSVYKIDIYHKYSKNTFIKSITKNGFNG